jgi:hypothetical protein
LRRKYLDATTTVGIHPAGVCVPLPPIRFQDIRPYEGSQNTGFEELCCQLAALETDDGRKEFVRKGRGGDAGVECFSRRPDASERGWQAKYVDQWDASLEGQLDSSIKQALIKHPKLTEYVVCIPFDLSDARAKRAGSKSAAQKWDDWRRKWISAAKADGRSLSVELWGASQIGERLLRDDPAYSGRLLYWFDRDALGSTWFREKFERTRASLGSRYVPESNVELPIRKAFLAFVRDPVLWKMASEWSDELLQAGSRAGSAVRGAVPAGTTEGHSTQIEAVVHPLAGALSTHPVALNAEIPVSGWVTSTEALKEAIYEAINWCRTLPAVPHPHTSSSKAEWAIHALYELRSLVDRIASSLNSLTWRLANINQVLLTGEAGSGKSHLLADVCDHQIARGAPAIMVLSSVLTDQEPWRQILTELDLPHRQVGHFLGALDAAAEAAGMRAIVCVDALNERHGIDIWPSRLAAFLKEVERFPRIVLCVSCRSTYVPFVIPDSLDENILPRLTHHGFGGTSGRAARYYLAKRGIVRTGVPNPLPEFENPLFLKTCCDFLLRQGEREIPRGLQGISGIFGFYLNAVVASVERAMKLDPTAQIVKRAVGALSEAYAERGEGYLPVPEVRTLFETILPSLGQLERSLLKQLESEGVLSIEPVRLDRGAVDEQVRFTFERLSDHEIAQRLLDRHLGKDGVRKAFAPGTPLFQVVAGDGAYRRAGVVEAIAVQLAERLKVELPDVLPKNCTRYVAHMAFQNSLLWRDQAYFSERTWQVAKKLLGPEEIDDLTINIATEPRNSRNALKLHAALAKLTMPERDKRWSTAIAYRQLDENSAIGNLIGWAFDQGLDEIEEERAELAAITLTWFLTTSSRVVRDRATKALACLLTHRLALAAKLLDHFAHVDDLYLQERLVGSIYGGVLQGTSTTGLAELADKVLQTFLLVPVPPLNALLREHSAGIVFYAHWRGAAPDGFDAKSVLPPYRSPWPIEKVSEKKIEAYKQDYGRGTFRDDIVGSAGLGGDFGRYVLPRVPNAFSPVPYGTEPLNAAGFYDAWLREFLDEASEEQLTAFINLVEVAKAQAEAGAKPGPLERAQLDGVEKAFKATLSREKQDDFGVRARDLVARGLRIETPWHQPLVEFDIGWASRWIIKRAHDFGWTPKRFGDWEGNNLRSYDRNEHAVERVGKKYQWLALNELAARMGDNLAFIGSQYADDQEPRTYRGAYDVGLRDIDPSLLVSKTEYDGWAEWPKTWWVPAEPQLGPLTPGESLTWLKSDADIINDASLIEVTNPKDGQRWLTLHSFGAWNQNEVIKGEKKRQRDTWFRLSCFVVRRRDAAKLMAALRGRKLGDESRMPKVELHGDRYLGEYPWHPYFQGFGAWHMPDEWHHLPVPVRVTSTSYACSKGGYDYSVDETIDVSLPAPWIVEGLGLRSTGGRDLTFVDGNGKLTFFDPSTYGQGYQAALIHRDAFLGLLARENLEAIWVIAGEKNAYGGASHHGGWGGSLAHTYLYRMKRGALGVEKFTVAEKPSTSQLKEFMEG